MKDFGLKTGTAAFFTLIPPHIDQLAKEGMLFTNYHSNGTVCSPTRADRFPGKKAPHLGSREDKENSYREMIWG